MTIARFIRLFKERLAKQIESETMLSDIGKKGLQAMVNDLLNELLLEALEED